MGSDRIGVVVGLAAEARIARRSGHRVEIGGGTPEGAAVAARALAESGVTALVSFGLAGGLDPALGAGTVLLPRAFLLDGVRVPADSGLTARLGGPTCDLLLCGAAIVATAAEKACLFGATAAAAVDLESAAVLRVAHERGLPVAALRAVCDPAGRSLPPAALGALSNAGAVAGWRVAGSLLRHPAQLPSLLGLARDAGAARRALLAAVLKRRPL